MLSLVKLAQTLQPVNGHCRTSSQTHDVVSAHPPLTYTKIPHRDSEGDRFECRILYAQSADPRLVEIWSEWISEGVGLIPALAGYDYCVRLRL